MNLADPPRWNEDELEKQLKTAAAAFREERLREPVELYRRVFEDYAARVRALLDRTNNLSHLASASQRALDEHASTEARQKLADVFEEILSDEIGLEALRYLAGPPISTDDLKTLAKASLAPSRLRRDSEMAARVLDVVLASLDSKRFPWVTEQRRPDLAERQVATLASASLMATQRVQTDRKNVAKTKQEKQVADYLSNVGLMQVGPRDIATSDDAPGRGAFCGECMFGDRKADLVVQLYDGRLMPVEYKVSNSATNSVKRLNNDAAAKATAWIDYFGRRQIVPTAVLSGVFKRHNLVQAQEAGLTIFWAHDLGPLGAFVDSTR